MLAVNFFWFWTSEWVSESQTQAHTEVAPVVKVDKVSHKLISSWAWEALLYWVLFVSVLFAYFTKKIA